MFSLTSHCLYVKQSTVPLVAKKTLTISPETTITLKTKMESEEQFSFESMQKPFVTLVGSFHSSDTALSGPGLHTR